VIVLRAFLIFLTSLGPVYANDMAQTADEAAAMMDAARKKLSAARSSKTQIRALVDAIRAYEVALVAMQGGLREIRSATISAQDRFEARRASVEMSLVAIQSIERASGPKRVWHPGGALASARSAMTMSDLLPVLNGEAEELRAELAGLATLTALQEAVEADMIEARGDMRQGVDDLQRAMVVKAAKAPPPEDRTRRLEELAQNALELGELADGLAALSPVNLEDVRDPPEENSMLWPVKGEILRRFNEADAANIERPGLVMSAPPQSLILSPHAAEVSYSGPFLEQGTVIVLELSGEHLLVLGGLGQSFVSTGDKVEEGTPLGILGSLNTSDEEFLIKLSDGNSAFRNESLYIEFRENGIAVDPTAWFRPAG